MKINTIQVKPIGIHFINWSIHYLSGETKYWSNDKSWKTLEADPLQNHNCHNHLIPRTQAPKWRDMLGQPEHDQRLITMYCIPHWPPGGWSYYRKYKRIEILELYTQYLKELKDNKWKTVFYHDMDYEMPLIDLRDNEIDINDHKVRDRLLLKMYQNLYPTRKINKNNLSEIALENLEREVQEKANVKKLMMEWIDDGLVLPFLLSKLLDQREQAFIELLDQLEMRLEPQRLEPWRVIYEKWNTRNQLALTFRSKIPEWCNNIVSGLNFPIPALDQSQIASLQRHLMRIHRTRLRNTTCFTNSQDYHNNLIKPGRI